MRCRYTRNRTAFFPATTTPAAPNPATVWVWAPAFDRSAAFARSACSRHRWRVVHLRASQRVAVRAALARGVVAQLAAHWHAARRRTALLGGQCARAQCGGTLRSALCSASLLLCCCLARCAPAAHACRRAKACCCAICWSCCRHLAPCRCASCCRTR